MAVGSPSRGPWQRNVFAENKVVQNNDDLTGPEYLEVAIPAGEGYSETFDFFNYKYVAIFVEDTLDADEIRFFANFEDSDDIADFYPVYNITGGLVSFTIIPLTANCYVADDDKSPKLKSLRWLKLAFYKGGVLEIQAAQSVKLLLIG
jgi:hypothetical protein